VPSLVVHLLIPPLVLLATGRFPWKLVVLLLPLSLLPDIDFFVPPHRALFHSVFLPVALLALAQRWRLQGKEERFAPAVVAAFYLGSHSLMDLFVGGVVPFWPITEHTFYIDAYVLVDTRTLEFFPTFEPGTQDGVPQVSPLYEFFEGVQAGMLALVLLTFGTLAVQRMRRTERRVVVVAPDEEPAPAPGHLRPGAAKAGARPGPKGKGRP
jgi:hypothetical protein